MAYTVRPITNLLPIAEYNNGKWDLSAIDHANDYTNWVQCKPYGEMDDGTMVWADNSGNHFYKAKFYGKYFFCRI